MNSIARTGRLISTILWLVLALYGSCSRTIAAQRDPNCKRPAELARALAKQPSAAAYDALGAYFGQRKEFSCAFSAFQSALRLEPNSWEAHYNFGLAYLESGDAERATREFRAAVRLKPELPQSHAALGTSLSQLNETDAAIEEFKAALRIDPQSVPALDGLTKVLIEQKRYSAAIAYLRKAPPDDTLQLNLATAYARNRNNDEALQILSRVVRKEPSSSLAHLNLGIVYTQQERYREAADQFRDALRLDPNNDVARVSLVEALAILAEFPSALPLIQEYARRKPRDFAALYLTGVVQRGLGNYADAEAPLRQAVALKSDNY